MSGEKLLKIVEEMRGAYELAKRSTGNIDGGYAAKWADRIESIAKAAQSEPVGEAGSMPGTSGFTMAAFRADDVPIGTKLYAWDKQYGQK